MKKILLILITIFGLAMFTQTLSVSAATPAEEACAGIEAAGGSCDASGANDAAGNIVLTIVNVLSWIVGAVAVIMIIIGGFRYIISGGDSTGVTGAKNTILYAIVGLFIVIFAQVIVAFVYKSATTPPESSKKDSSKTEVETDIDAEPVDQPADDAEPAE